MRIYYVMEAQGRRCQVRTALGVDARAWNRLHRRVHEWRRQLERNQASPQTAACAPLNCWPPQRRPVVAAATRSRGRKWWPRGCASSRTSPWRPAASK